MQTINHASNQVRATKVNFYISKDISAAIDELMARYELNGSQVIRSMIIWSHIKGMENLYVLKKDSDLVGSRKVTRGFMLYPDHLRIMDGMAKAHGFNRSQMLIAFVYWFLIDVSDYTYTPILCGFSDRRSIIQ